MPRPIADKVNRDLAKELTTERVKARLGELGAETIATPERSARSWQTKLRAGAS